QGQVAVDHARGVGQRRPQDALHGSRVAGRAGIAHALQKHVEVPQQPPAVLPDVANALAAHGRSVDSRSGAYAEGGAGWPTTSGWPQGTRYPRARAAVSRWRAGGWRCSGWTTAFTPSTTAAPMPRHPSAKASSGTARWSVHVTAPPLTTCPARPLRCRPRFQYERTRSAS